MKKIIYSIFILFIFILNSNFAYAKNNEDQKLNILSDKVEIIRNKGQIIFTGKVIAKRSNFTLYTDRMVVRYKESKNEKIDITDITAEKNVKFTTNKVVATGDDGFYDIASNRIILKNNVKATEDGITVFAREFEYNTVTGKTKIIGNENRNERVTVILDNVDNLNEK